MAVLGACWTSPLFANRFTILPPKIDGVDYLIMKESDIMGVLDQSVTRKKAA
jgi:hypothetical protein